MPALLRLHMQCSGLMGLLIVQATQQPRQKRQRDALATQHCCQMLAGARMELYLLETEVHMQSEQQKLLSPCTADWHQPAEDIVAA